MGPMIAKKMKNIICTMVKYGETFYRMWFTGGYIIFLISAQKQRLCRRGGSNEYPNLYFEHKYEEYQNFLSENFHFR